MTRRAWRRMRVRHSRFVREMARRFGERAEQYRQRVVGYPTGWPDARDRWGSDGLPLARASL